MHGPNKQYQENACILIKPDISATGKLMKANLKMSRGKRKKYLSVKVFGVKNSLPAPTYDPFAITWLPWLPNVTPRFSRVPPKTVYMVAICSMVAFRAALSDCFQSQTKTMSSSSHEGLSSQEQAHLRTSHK